MMKIIDTLAFDEAQITSPTNGNNPQWGGCCHALSKECGRIDVIIKYEQCYENSDGEEILRMA